MLTDIQTLVLNRGKQILNSLGLRYAIEMPDQTITGNLPVPKLPEVKARKWGPRLDPKYGYISKIKSMPVGETLAIDAEDSAEAERLRSAMSSVAAKAFGNQSHKTMVTDKCVKIFRIQ